jgi:hypothetical protein
VSDIPPGTTAWIADCTCGDRYVAGHFGLGPRAAAVTLARRRGCADLVWTPVVDVPADSGVRMLVSLGAILPAEVIRSAARSAWVDCIAWIRAAPPPSAAAYDIRIAEAYFTGGGAEGIEEGAPLLDIPERGPHPGRDVVLSLGGVHSQALADEDLGVALDVVLGAAGRAFARRPDVSCTVLLPADLIDSARARPDAAALRFEAVAPGAFHAHLATASAAIVQPGLAGPFEAFGAGVPTAITLPFTWTQLHQTLEFERRGLLVLSQLATRFVDPFRSASRDVSDEPAITAALVAAHRALTEADREEYSRDLLAVADASTTEALTVARRTFVRERLRLPSIADRLGAH